LALHHPHQVIGYHSCDQKVGMKILNGEEELRLSTNGWDWLGPGAYFWEDNPQRALEYAEECAVGMQVFAGKISKPFVLGAIIDLGNCLNLIETSSSVIVQQAHAGLIKTLKEGGQKIPINKGDNRKLDCAVMQFVHQSNISRGIPPYDTVRCAFPEGEAIYAGSNFTTRLHIEIAVCNLEMIKGYFLPRPIERFNKHLSHLKNV